MKSNYGKKMKRRIVNSNGENQKKNTKKGGLEYKMNKRTISLKGENKKQDKHEGRISNTKT
jgi:hypothetical protein